MAKTTTTHINDMSAGSVADETREWFRIVSDKDAVDAAEVWDAFDADNAQWLLDHPGEKAPEFAAVIDPGDVKMSEKVFVEVRFFEVDGAGKILPINAPWCQVNSTNTPGLSAGLLADLLKVFNARRTFLGRDPV